MTEKVCSKCGVLKPLAHFYKDCSSADGVRSHCKECNKAAVKLYQQSPQGRAVLARYYRSPRRRAVNRAAQARYWRSPKGPATHARAERKYASRHPDRLGAHTAVGNAVQTGRLKREPCEVCGAEPADGHHDDYAKPLEVRWLCPVCHSKLHRGELAVQACRRD